MRDRLISRVLFRLRLRQGLRARLHQALLRAQGLRCGAGTRLPRSFSVNWPDQVSLGAGCVVQDGVSIDFCHGVPMPGPSIVIGDRAFIGRSCEINIRVGLRIGHDALIASGCKFIDHNHGMQVGTPMRQQSQMEGAIVLGNDVWLGVNAVVLRGVHIGDGAVVGAGSVVTKSVPAGEIWAGIPARCIGYRQDRAAAGQANEPAHVDVH